MLANADALAVGIVGVVAVIVAVIVAILALFVVALAAFSVVPTQTNSGEYKNCGIIYGINKQILV